MQMAPLDGSLVDTLMPDPGGADRQPWAFLVDLFPWRRQDSRR
jgi:hypothetical protein